MLSVFGQHYHRLFSRIILFSSLLCAVSRSLAQTVFSGDTVKPVIPMNRILWHEQIDKEQKRVDKLDGKTDGIVKLSLNDDINVQITDALLRRIDELQIAVERKSIDHNTKIGYLRGLKELLQEYQKQVRIRRANAVYAPVLIESYDNCMALVQTGQSIVPIFQNLHYEAAEQLIP
jgi:hypothetical protein